jgi:4-amino-4-deoxy-L-arabinose transferase-like glycosyltransferase
MRVPSVLTGAACVLLMFLVRRRIFGSESLAFVAAALLALSPAHFIQSRIATQQIAPVFFVLLWLLLFLRYAEKRRLADLFAAGAALGCGIYSYVAAAVALPVYFAAMLAVLVCVRRNERPASPPLLRVLGTAACGFLLMLLPAHCLASLVSRSHRRRHRLLHPPRLQRGPRINRCTERAWHRDTAGYLVEHVQPRTPVRHGRQRCAVFDKAGGVPAGTCRRAPGARLPADEQAPAA